MPEAQPPVQIYFSDFFEVSQDTLRAHGAFNISLVNDLPLFIDPFLLFNSQKPSMRRPVSVKPSFLCSVGEAVPVQPSRHCRHPSIRTLW